MEQEGIYYFFEHSENEHTLVLADSAERTRPGPGLRAACRTTPTPTRCRRMTELRHRAGATSRP